MHLASVIIRKRRVLLLTKFTMMKLKIDVSLFPLFFFKMLYVGSYLLLVQQSVLYILIIIKRKCKTAFSIKFKTRPNQTKFRKQETKIDVFRKLIGNRSNQRRCFVKKGIFKNSQENTCVGVSFLTTSLKERP